MLWLEALDDDADRLIAQNLVYHVDPGEEKVIQLLGWSDGAQVRAESHVLYLTACS